MSRLDKLEVHTLDDDQRALYDSIVGGARARGPQAFALTDATGRLEGPFNAMLLSPPVGAALQALGSAVRYASTLTDRCREIAILVVADHWASDFETYAHVAVGRLAGLTDEEVGLLHSGHRDALSDDTERTVAQTAYALAARHDLDDAEYGAAEQCLGARALFELTTIVGYYATLALQLRVYQVARPGGATPAPR